MVDKFKKWRMSVGLSYIQITEMELHVFTEDKPIARKFFEKVLEYRRNGAAGIETFKIPMIATDSTRVEEPVKAPAMEPQKAAAAVESAAEKTEPEAEPEKEESPFEF